MMRLTVIAAMTTMIFAAGALSGCNTVEGAGKDIQNTGEWIQDTF